MTERKDSKMLKNTNALEKYDIFPKVLPVGKTVTVTIEARDPSVLTGELTLSVAGINDGPNGAMFPSVDYTRVKNGISFVCNLPLEQEYHVRIGNRDNGKRIVTLHIYALEKDLLDRLPLMGDFHSHSCRSDGQEAPAFVAATYRRAGFDFVSLTDHRRYAPSLEARAAFAGLDIPFVIYPGEEVHTPDNFVHIVNFASDISVNGIALDRKEVADWTDKTAAPGWLERVERVSAELGALPDDIERFRFQIASCKLVSDIIREGGGMSIYAHPHWLCNVRNAPDGVSRYVLSGGLFDAFELIGGQSCHENQMQVALYYDILRNGGGNFGVVGSSDQHGTLNVRYGSADDTYTMFTEERTLVFAGANTREEIIDAVKGGWSLAIEKYLGSGLHYYGGSYRLTQYAAFLFNEYFPIRDKMLFAEGELMCDYLQGDMSAGERLVTLCHINRTKYDRYFCR